MEQESAGRRALPAVAVALVVLGVGALVAARGCGGPPEGARTVRTSAPRQASAPGTARPDPQHVLERGETPPRLVLPDLAGAMQDVSSRRGQVVVLNVWASWCGPCVREMPSIQRLHEAEDGRFVVVTVSVDEDRTAARALAERVGLTAPVLLDPGGDRLAQWGTVKYPETWILDREGVVVERVIGGADWASPEVLAYLSRL